MRGWRCDQFPRRLSPLPRRVRRARDNPTLDPGREGAQTGGAVMTFFIAAPVVYVLVATAASLQHG